MTIYEIAKQAVADHQCCKIKPRVKTETDNEWETGQYDRNDWDTGRNKKWILLDAMTAQAIVTVHDNIKPENQIRFLNMPLVKLVNICWKCIS